MPLDKETQLLIDNTYRRGQHQGYQAALTTILIYLSDESATKEKIADEIRRLLGSIGP
jgi:hypothetical protein